ncbi:MAG: response regulator, partial [Gammaproteobacteria bacterium]|nr:response regulator [Gammaproteobacteria bacterium]
MARILVVDDYADFREVVRLLLERQGHEVLEAEDGIEAVQVCRNSHPDLVILDIFMPGKDGIETLWEIR